MSVLSYNSLSVNLNKNILNFEIHNIWKNNNEIYGPETRPYIMNKKFKIVYF